MKINSFMLGAAAALLLATSCSNDEVVQTVENSRAIGFSSFVNNATRTDYDSANLPGDLNVYGTSEGNVPAFIVFNGDKVTKNGTTWTYDNPRYWVSGNSYSFAAIAPFGAATVTQGSGSTFGGLTAISFTNPGNIDLLFGAKDAAAGTADWGAQVMFDLKHLLSRVKFALVNKMESDVYYIEVKDVKITDAADAGTYTPVAVPATANWEASVTTKSYEFGGEDVVYTANNNATATTDSQNLIPVYQDPENTGEAEGYAATFTIVLHQLIGDADTTLGTYTHNVTLPGLNFNPGYSYLFSAEITPENIIPGEDELSKIEFSAQITEEDDWKDATPDQNLPTQTVKTGE